MARYQKVATKLGYFLHIQANRKATLHMLRRLGGFCTSTLLMTHQQSLPKRVRQEQAAKLPSPGAGWLGKLGIVYLNGKNLFETLMLNLVLINNDNVESEEHPLWERDVPPTSERREIPYPTILPSFILCNQGVCC